MIYDDDTLFNITCEIRKWNEERGFHEDVEEQVVATDVKWHSDIERSIKNHMRDNGVWADAGWEENSLYAYNSYCFGSIGCVGSKTNEQDERFIYVYSAEEK